MKPALLVLALLAAQDPPVTKLKFQVEHFNLETKKAAPLKAEEAKSFAGELKELPAVQDATCTETTATVVLKPDVSLRWTEMKAIGKKTLTYDGGKPVIVFNTLKLDGHVTVTLHVEKNADKVVDALKGLGFQEVMAFTLSNPSDQFEKMGLPRGWTVDIKNAITEDHNLVRVSLLPGLLSVARANLHRDLPQRLFETGMVLLEGEDGQHDPETAGGQEAPQPLRSAPADGERFRHSPVLKNRGRRMADPSHRVDQQGDERQSQEREGPIRPGRGRRRGVELRRAAGAVDDPRRGVELRSTGAADGRHRCS